MLTLLTDDIAFTLDLVEQIKCTQTVIEIVYDVRLPEKILYMYYTPEGKPVLYSSSSRLTLRCIFNRHVIVHGGC